MGAHYLFIRKTIYGLAKADQFLLLWFHTFVANELRSSSLKASDFLALLDLRVISIIIITTRVYISKGKILFGIYPGFTKLQCVVFFAIHFSSVLCYAMIDSRVRVNGKT